MNATTTKAELYSQVLEGFVLSGAKRCARLMDEAEGKITDDPEAAERLHAQWGRMTRRVMQAMVLDDRLGRAHAEDRRKAEERDKPEPQSDPEVERRRTDILAQFRIDGLDHDDEIALKDLLGEMDDDEMLAYPLLQQLGRIAEHLHWEPHSAVVEAARAHAALEAAEAKAKAEAEAEAEAEPEPAPEPSRPRPKLIASDGEQGPSEPERSAIWRRQMAQIERERAQREAEARERDGQDTS